MLPVEAGHASVKDPNAQSGMGNVISDIEQKAAYFTIEDWDCFVKVEHAGDLGELRRLCACTGALMSRSSPPSPPRTWNRR